jgi:hypothetical protein
MWCATAAVFVAAVGVGVATLADVDRSSLAAMGIGVGDDALALSNASFVPSCGVYLSFPSTPFNVVCAPGANASDRVVEMHVQGPHSSFSLSAAVGGLAELQVLRLLFVSVVGGTLPVSIASLTRLQQLVVIESALSGEIPPGISALPALQVLHLGWLAPTSGLARFFYDSATRNALTGERVLVASRVGS